MNDQQTIRETVARDYARALTVSGAGCCGSTPKGILARQAGYQEFELTAVPEEAVLNSFGCGNPLAFSEVRPGDVVLDLGCGAGIDVALTASKVGSEGRVIGVDMTDEMVAEARRMARSAGLINVEIRKGLIEDVPVKSESVDWVISNCVINLSPEKPRVFAEIARVLRPGGRMVISDIIAENLPPTVRENMRLHSCCVAGALSEANYRAGLQHAGLAEIAIRKLRRLNPGQLSNLVESDRQAAGLAAMNGPGATLELAEAEVWTANVTARKP